MLFRSMSDLSYLRDVLGLKSEGEPSIDGDWMAGPRVTFMMEGGYSHWYQGWVSPNNICGKLKFFMATSPKPDRSAHQRVGELGITLHSFYTAKLAITAHCGFIIRLYRHFGQLDSIVSSRFGLVACLVGITIFCTIYESG